jgi:FlaA1/EpsC-like NDP-sugar epimerase
MNPFSKLLNWYFSKESLPFWCLFLADSIIVLFSGLLTFWAENRTLVMFNHRYALLYTVLLYVAISWIGSRLFKTYLGVVRYSSFVDLMKVAYANIVSTAIVIIVSLVLEHYEVAALCAFTQTEIIITFIIATLFMWAMRVVVKTLHDVTHSENQPLTRVLIYGAMSGGIGIAKNIRTQKPTKYELCGFISHDKRAKNMTLLGEKVYNVDDDIASIIEKEKIQSVLVSPLRLDDFRNNQKIQDVLIHAGVKIFFAQQAKEASVKDGELTEDDFANVQLKEVQVEDLLPRQEIKVDMDSVGEMLTGKRVLITGSAGSIGSEMVRQVAIYKPSAMMLIDQAETPEHDIRLMMKKDYPNIMAETVVTTICREDRMEQIFSEFKPDYVFHAAAYKHVPMMEDNPSEAVLNNIYGTKVIADLSVKYGVKKFVMVSTDKAVNPTNVMGCSKRICEIYVQSLNNTQDKCQFVTTRFGNVLGSNGSVIPLFREQIRTGGPVTVTDERIVRFFMLIPEACKLVLEAGTKGNGGEIFVFDMGKPVKIIDLAKRMIALSGAKNVEIKITGLREGEKLYEEVLNELEGTKPSFHEKIRIAEVRQYDYTAVSKEIDELIKIAHQYDKMAIVAKMKAIVPEYKSNNSIYEKLDK